MSFIELKTSQQMTEGAFLLANSDLTINEVIYKVGCNNTNYFYRKFQTIYGMTPKEYRNTANGIHSFTPHILSHYSIPLYPFFSA